MIVLTYHRIDESDCFCDPLGVKVSKKNFENHMRFLSDYYNVVGLNDNNLKEVNENSVVITFDDGYKDFQNIAFPILKELELNATLFIATDGITSGKSLWDTRLGDCFPTYDEKGFYKIIEPYLQMDKYESLIHRLEVEEENHYQNTNKNGSALSMLNEYDIRMLNTEKNVSIGAHTIHHCNLTSLNIKEVLFEIYGSIRALEEIIHDKIKCFSYPFGRYEPWLFNILKEYGIEKAVNTDFGRFDVNKDEYLSINRNHVFNYDLSKFKIYMDLIEKTKYMGRIRKEVIDNEILVIFGLGGFGRSIYKKIIYEWKIDCDIYFCDNNTNYDNSANIDQRHRVFSPKEAVREFPEAEYIIGGRYALEMGAELISFGINNILWYI